MWAFTAVLVIFGPIGSFLCEKSPFLFDRPSKDGWVYEYQGLIGGVLTVLGVYLAHHLTKQAMIEARANAVNQYIENKYARFDYWKNKLSELRQEYLRDDSNPVVLLGIESIIESLDIIRDHLERFDTSCMSLKKVVKVEQMAENLSTIKALSISLRDIVRGSGGTEDVLQGFDLLTQKLSEFYSEGAKE